MIEVLPLVNFVHCTHQRRSLTDGIQACHGIGKRIERFAVQKAQQGIQKLHGRLFPAVIKGGKNICIIGLLRIILGSILLQLGEHIGPEPFSCLGIIFNDTLQREQVLSF